MDKLAPFKTTEELLNLAKKWRASQSEKHYKTGVILIWEGEVYGWKNCLRDAKHERPGAIAVDEEEHVFIAEGGNEYDGAKCWVALPRTDAEIVKSRESDPARKLVKVDPEKL